MGKVQTCSFGLPFGVVDDLRIHICCKEGAHSALLLLHLRCGAYDHEAGSSRAKRSRNVETVEEAILPDVHHEFLEWRGCNREAKSRYNSWLATLIPKLIYSPQIVDWQLLHKIGCGDEIDQMLKISLKEAQSDEEIFFFVAWVRAFNIREPIYPELCHEFYATYEFDEELEEEGFDTYFKGGLRSDEKFNAREYWDLHLSRSSITSVRFLILRVLHKMITYGLCQRTTGYEKIQRNDLWLLSMFEDRHQNGYANVAWVIAKWMKRKGAGSQKDSQICFELPSEIEVQASFDASIYMCVWVARKINRRFMCVPLQSTFNHLIMLSPSYGGGEGGWTSDSAVLSQQLPQLQHEMREWTSSVRMTRLDIVIVCHNYDWSDQAEEGPTNFALMAYSSTSSNSDVSTDSNCSSSYLENVKFLKEQNEQLLKDLRTSKINAITYKISLESVKARLLVYKKNKYVYEEDIKLLKYCQIVDKCKAGLGYNVVPPPYTGNFMPPKPNLSFSSLEEFVNEPIVSKPTVKKPVVKTSEAKASADKPKAVKKNNGALIIEDWVSDSEEEDMPQDKIQKKIVKPSFAMTEFVKPKGKTARKTVKQVDCKKVNQKQFQNTKPIWNNAKRVNHQNFAKKTHPCPKKNMVPRAVLMKSGLVSLNTARQVNTAHLKIIMNSARPMTNLSKTTHSTVKRPIHKNTTFKNNTFNQRVNTVKDKNVNTVRPKAVVNASRPKAVVNVVKGNNANVVKASACWANPQIDLQDKRVIDSGCSRHITRNMSYLTDFEEIDGGYVSFRGNLKGGKITGRGSKLAMMQFSRMRVQTLSDDEKKVDEDPRKDSESIDQEKDDSVNSTNNVNVASTNEVNVVGRKAIIELLDEPNMPALEDIVYSDDDEDVGAEVDMNNLDTTIQDKGDILLVQVYVDDIIFSSTKKSLCIEFEKMMQRKFQISSMGELIFFLELQVALDHYRDAFSVIYLIYAHSSNAPKPIFRYDIIKYGNWKKKYAGTLPLCTKCNYHHKGHYKRDCPELKNQNHGNQAGSMEARGVVHAFRGGETKQDLNNIEYEIEA
ncbi:hypothetical protein Tco_0144570 [Tanacetum coccineum]